jgi:outer membrane receptor protein involved in Fe transport
VASFGVEARRDTTNVTHDLANQPYYNQYFLSYGLDYAGRIDVVEGSTEVVAPLLKDLPLAKYLELDGAFRYTNNKNHDDTTGSPDAGASVSNDINSWKLSTIWDTTDWLRVRATRSRDVRAAGFRELYESYAVAGGGPFGTISGDPVSTLPTEAITAITGGNIHLEPEKADTTTAGIVFAPKSGPLERLQFSADWYRIVINDPITGPPFGLGVQNIVNLCYRQHVQAACNRITVGPSAASPTGQAILVVNNTAVNLGGYETRGVDFEALYSLPLASISSSLNGNLRFRLLTSLLYDMTIDNGLGGPPVEYAGQSGPTAAFGGFNTSPRWQSNFFLTYESGPLTATVQLRYIGQGKYEALSGSGKPAIGPGQPGYVTTSPYSISNNSVPGVTYLNLSGAYSITPGFQVFAAINNVLNKDPPIAPGGNGYPTNPVYFDTYGMTWKVGVRAKF